ncbi:MULTISPECIES: nitroreductase family deazaflavin-dependent oxidoreductase [unclassified Nocardia]|uniref:nitroreductase family deazaflavin-dependent oxidoreductase n=1 Tax=unclassified Nocardia TaxID=2637762 RepID=UPI001CE3CAAF|nr:MULTISPECIES: nitroreductase family deazaflavin-dependent oxidoreductase [unclassified Nocardia]
MTLPRALGKFNRYATNQVAGLVAGRAPGFGIVVHRGRKSGRVYRTPVSVFERDGGYRIALTYGTGVDWLKNVLAAGDFELQVRGKVVELTNPVVHHDPSAGWAPAPVRLVLQTISATDYVQAQPA